MNSHVAGVVINGGDHEVPVSLGAGRARRGVVYLGRVRVRVVPVGAA